MALFDQGLALTNCVPRTRGLDTEHDVPRDVESVDRSWISVLRNHDIWDGTDLEDAHLASAKQHGRQLAVVLQELANNPETNPIEVMAQSGIDINEVMKDEETRQKVSDKLAAYQQKQLDDEKENELREKNLQNSAQALQSIGVTPEEASKLWEGFFTDIVDQALSGIVTAETWQMLMKAKNYDADIKAAKEQAAMRARNEKMQNNVKDFQQKLPPTLSQATNQTATPKRKKGGFFSGLTEAGY